LTLDVGTHPTESSARRGWLRRYLALVLALAAVLTAVALYFASGPKSSYAHVVLGSGPVGYWRMDDSGCCTAADASGNGNLATYHQGPSTQVPGIVAGGDAAVRLTGNYLVAPVGELHFGEKQAFTLSAWVEMPNRENQTVASVTVGGTTGFALSTRRSAHGPSFMLLIDQTALVKGIPLPAGKPQYLVITYDGGEAYTLFENGKHVKSKHASSLGYSNTPELPPPLVIGAANATTGSHLAHGVVDDVALWGRVLPASQIEQQYRLGVG
jgi:concanavalin A-like lectin/glucanase superfamily protein